MLYACSKRSARGGGWRESREIRGKSAVMGTVVAGIPRGWIQTARGRVGMRLKSCPRAAVYLQFCGNEDLFIVLSAVTTTTMITTWLVTTMKKVQRRSWNESA